MVSNSKQSTHASHTHTDTVLDQIYSSGQSGEPIDIISLNKRHRCFQHPSWTNYLYIYIQQSFAQDFVADVGSEPCHQVTAFSWKGNCRNLSHAMNFSGAKGEESRIPSLESLGATLLSTAEVGFKTTHLWT